MCRENDRNAAINFTCTLILFRTIFTGDCLDMRSNSNCTDAADIDVHRLATISRLAARFIFSLHRD